MVSFVPVLKLVKNIIVQGGAGLLYKVETRYFGLSHSAFP